MQMISAAWRFVKVSEIDWAPRQKETRSRATIRRHFLVLVDTTHPFCLISYHKCHARKNLLRALCYPLSDPNRGHFLFDDLLPRRCHSPPEPNRGPCILKLGLLWKNSRQCILISRTKPVFSIRATRYLPSSDAYRTQKKDES